MSRPKKPSRDLEGIMEFLKTTPFSYVIVLDIVYFTVVSGDKHVGFEIGLRHSLDDFVLKYGKFARACQEKHYDAID